MNEHNYVKPKEVKDPRNKPIEVPRNDECLVGESGLYSNDPNIVCSINGKKEHGKKY